MILPPSPWRHCKGYHLLDSNFSQKPEKSRFEWQQDGAIAFANYAIKDEIIFIEHVEAPQALRGTGAAGKLMQHIANYAQTHALKIKPICSYAAAWMRKHKEYHSLLVA